ncbi:MAG: glycosyltransferase [Clostridia bacterium]|nr:glycosyltransferase [Clostridia bacterium]
MIITVVCDIYGRENNGSAIVAYNLIRFLKAQGHTVRILCADQSKKREPGYWVVPNLNFGKLLNAYVNKVGVTLAKPHDRIIKASMYGVDAVHIMMPLTLGLAAVKIAHEMHLPITAGFHMQAQNFTAYFKLNWSKSANEIAYSYMWQHFYRYCTCIHYPTQFIRDEFEGSINKQTPGYVISNGVHEYVKRRESPKPPELQDKIVVLTTGRYATEKSQDTLIKAVSLSKYKDKIQLILGGEGAKEGLYRQLAKDLPIQPIFKFYSRTEIIDVLNYADIYVHPAQIELEGISCIEAIACGKLTIVSDSKLSATRHFAVDDSCIFKSRDEKDLARVLDYWIENPEKRKEYADKYLNSAVAYKLSECMKRMENMIYDAIDKVYGPLPSQTKPTKYFLVVS